MACREMVVRGDGLVPLIALLGGGNVKVQAAAGAALWQLSGDTGINEEIGLLGGPRATVQALRAKSTAVHENVAGLVASLAQSRHNAVSGLSS